MKRTLKTFAALAALAWLTPSTTASAQEEMTIVEALEMTTQQALEALQRTWRPGDPSWQHPHLPAIYILRQVDPSACRFHAEDRVPLPGGGFENRCRFDPAPRTAAELDAFADQVAAMAADASLPEHVRANAEVALAGAAELDGTLRGKPYVRGFDLLVQLYEGGYDVLYAILSVDPVRGPAYVQDVFQRSERPPLCWWGHVDPLPGAPPVCEGYDFWRDARETTWCRVGELLYRDTVSQAWERTPGGEPPWDVGERFPVPEGLPEHVDDWHRRCR